MTQTDTRKRRLACLELSLLEHSGLGEAVKWIHSYGSAIGLIENAEKLQTEGKLSWGKTEFQEALKKVSQRWHQGLLSVRALQVLEACKAGSIGWVCFEDEAYPQRLKEISNYPAVLYYIGDLTVLTKPCVSIVGSRRATVYGQKAAYEVAAASATADITVVSGLARGIDASAHKGALDAKGKTVAVMAGGLDLCYPKNHSWLYHRIGREGLVLSEYPPQSPAEKWHFIHRNRLISGLSEATVVAQAGLKSGSIRTAQFAAEQGREVFGIPGNIFDLEYLGVHNLIQDGANVLTSVKEIARIYGSVKKETQVELLQRDPQTEYGSRIANDMRMDIETVQAELQKQNSENQIRAGGNLWLYSKIDEFGRSPEQLSEITGRSIADVQMALTGLELDGLIRRDAWQQVTKV